MTETNKGLWAEYASERAEAFKAYRAAIDVASDCLNHRLAEINQTYRFLRWPAEVNG